MAPPGVHEVAGEVIGWLGKTCSDTKLNEYNEQELVDGSRPDLYSSKMWLGCFLRNRFPSLLITGKKNVLWHITSFWLLNGTCHEILKQYLFMVFLRPYSIFLHEIRIHSCQMCSFRFLFILTFFSMHLLPPPSLLCFFLLSLAEQEMGPLLPRESY